VLARVGEDASTPGARRCPSALSRPRPRRWRGIVGREHPVQAPRPRVQVPERHLVQRVEPDRWRDRRRAGRAGRMPRPCCSARCSSTAPARRPTARRATPGGTWRCRTGAPPRPASRWSPPALAAVTGPNLVAPMGRVAGGWGVPALAGPFILAAVAYRAAGLTVLLRPDPMLLAERLRDGAQAATAPMRHRREHDGRRRHHPRHPRAGAGGRRRAHRVGRGRRRRGVGPRDGRHRLPRPRPRRRR
jgi:hypothetical protein